VSPPASTPLADEVYARLEPVARQDADLGYPLLVYLVALSQMWRQVEAIVRSTDGKPAWSQALDVDRCPDFLLPWLAQFVGVVVTPNIGEAAQREQIRNVGGFKRGSPASLVAAIASTLTGTQFVSLIERNGGDAYAMLATLRTAETPDLAHTTAVAALAKAAGLSLTIIASAWRTYAMWEVDWPGTYTDVENAFATYADAEAVPL
jgi:hypothetical protein